MQVTNRRTGEVVQLPDEYDDDQIINHFAGQQATPLAQSFIGSAQQNVGPQLAQTLAQGPQRSTLPNIGGGAMVGLTPQQAQFTLQSAQQSNVDSMEQRMRQQQQVQNSIEAEKDRSQTLKLRQQELKNAIQERKIAADLAKFEAEQEGITKTIEAEEKTRQAEIEAENKWVNVPAGGGIFNPASGQMLEGPERQFAPPAPQRPIMPPQETRTMINPETGVPTDYRITYDPQTGMIMSQVELGPSASRSNAGGAVTPTQRFELIQRQVQNMMNAQLDQSLSPDSPGWKTYDQLFAEATRFVDSSIGGQGGVTQTPPQPQTPQQGPAIIDGPTPEQQEEMRILRQSGVNVFFDYNTGRPVFTERKQ